MTATAATDIDVTIVVATLNAAAHLADALASIGDELERCQQAGYSAEVLIADGGSTDATLTIAKGFFLSPFCRAPIPAFTMVSTAACTPRGAWPLPLSMRTINCCPMR